MCNFPELSGCSSWQSECLELRFTPDAWAKLTFLRDLGPTEIGGFGVTTTTDLLLVTEFHLVKQVCSAESVRFDDDAVADFIERQVDRGLRPEQAMRVWVHTHVADTAVPSLTDRMTFWRVFRRCNWSAMFILSASGGAYAELRVSDTRWIGLARVPANQQARDAAVNHQAWRREYEACVTIDTGSRNRPHGLRRFLPQRYFDPGSQDNHHV